MTTNSAFTLLELIVVIVILGILATLGFTQYSTVVESTRLAEAKTRIGNMRQLATEYYWKNGSMDGLLDEDLGVNNTCTSSHYFKYRQSHLSNMVSLNATRCTTAGKTPHATREYLYYFAYYPGAGASGWHCYYTDDNSPCFGLPQ
ncbi:MAG: type II secretion system protein [Candidatus Omnitrophica bacterium]|nr:type II secretion system protein [Candidatus Omnitrophota bacterium]